MDIKKKRKSAKESPGATKKLKETQKEDQRVHRPGASANEKMGETTSVKPESKSSKKRKRKKKRKKEGEDSRSSEKSTSGRTREKKADGAPRVDGQDAADPKEGVTKPMTAKKSKQAGRKEESSDSSSSSSDSGSKSTDSDASSDTSAAKEPGSSLNSAFSTGDRKSAEDAAASSGLEEKKQKQPPSRENKNDGGNSGDDRGQVPGSSDSSVASETESEPKRARKAKRVSVHWSDRMSCFVTSDGTRLDIEGVNGPITIEDEKPPNKEGSRASRSDEEYSEEGDSDRRNEEDGDESTSSVKEPFRFHSRSQPPLFEGHTGVSLLAGKLPGHVKSLALKDLSSKEITKFMVAWDNYVAEVRRMSLSTGTNIAACSMVDCVKTQHRKVIWNLWMGRNIAQWRDLSDQELGAQLKLKSTTSSDSKRVSTRQRVEESLIMLPIDAHHSVVDRFWEMQAQYFSLIGEDEELEDDAPLYTDANLIKLMRKLIVPTEVKDFVDNMLDHDRPDAKKDRQKFAEVMELAHERWDGPLRDKMRYDKSKRSPAGARPKRAALPHPAAGKTGHHEGKKRGQEEQHDAGSEGKAKHRKKKPGQHKVRPEAGDSKGSDKGRQRQMSCYNCGTKGHSAAACTQNGPTCFNCGETGHKATVCSKPKKQKVNRISDKSDGREVIMGKLNGHDVSIFPDSGSDLNVIPSGVLEGLIEKGVEMRIQPPNRATNLLMANGHTVGVKRVTWLKLTVDLVDKLNTTRTVSFCVLEGASVTEKDVILGRPLMRQLGIPVPDDFFVKRGGEPKPGTQVHARLQRIKVMHPELNEGAEDDGYLSEDMPRFANSVRDKMAQQQAETQIGRKLGSLPWVLRPDASKGNVAVELKNTSTQEEGVAKEGEEKWRAAQPSLFGSEVPRLNPKVNADELAGGVRVPTTTGQPVQAGSGVCVDEYAPKAGVPDNPREAAVSDSTKPLSRRQLKRRRRAAATAKVHAMAAQEAEEARVRMARREGGEEELSYDAANPPHDDGLDAALEAMLQKAVDSGVNEKVVKSLRRLIAVEMRDAWRVALRDEPGALVEVFDCELVAGAKMPRPQGHRKYAPLHREAIKEKVDALLFTGMIRHSTGTTYASPVIIVVKPNGRGFRMVVDFRGINRISVQSVCAFPNIEQVISLCEGSASFSVCDLTGCYWQIPASEAASKLFAFSTPDGCFEPLRMPQGAAGAAQHAQRVIMRALQEDGLWGRIGYGIGTSLWIDDLFMWADNDDNMLLLLERVLKCLNKRRLYLSPEKSEVMLKQVVWCGHSISAEGVCIDPERLRALEEVPIPTDAGALMQFLAAANWVRSYVPEYSKLSGRLTAFLNKAIVKCKRKTKRQAANVALVDHGWGREQEQWFLDLRRGVAEAVKLSHPKADYEFHLFSDASDTGWGVMLTQTPPEDVHSGKPVEDWRHEPLAFLSGLFRGASANWSTVEQEAFALVQGCAKLEYMIVRQKPVNLWTDSKTLSYIMSPEGRPASTTRATAAKVERWALSMRELNYTLQHISGEENVWADMLSRMHPASARAARRVKVRAVTVDFPAAGSGPRVIDGTVQDTKGGAPWPTIDEIAAAQRACLEGQVDPLTGLAEAEGQQLRLVEGLWRTQAGRLYIPPDPFDHTAAAVGGAAEQLEQLEELPSLRLRLLTIAHMGTSGHRRFKATLGALSTRFFWGCLKDDVEAFLSDCLQCAKTAGTNVKPLQWGHQVQADYPGEVLHFDYLYIENSGEKSEVGQPHYLLVLKDGFSNTVQLTPCVAPTAVLAADAILQWIATYGAPEVLISDNGSHFSNLLMDEVKRALSAEHHFTTPLAAWANGGVEVVNRHVLKVLRALVSENKMQFSEWQQLVPALMMVLNHSPAPTLDGLAPVEVMTGRQPTHSLDAVYRLHERPGRRPTIEMQAAGVSFGSRARKATQQLRSSIAEMHRRVRKAKGRKRKANLAAQQRRSESAAKKRGIEPHGGYSVGQYVLATRVNPTNKLMCRWLGPMRVVKVLSNWTYRVESLITGRTYDRHANMLKHYSDSNLKLTQSLLSIVGHDDAVYLVSKILQWRWQPESQEVQLLIQWEGLPEPSWEPLATMAVDVRQRVQRFCDKHWHVRGAQQLRRSAIAAGLSAPKK